MSRRRFRRLQRRDDSDGSAEGEVADAVDAADGTLAPAVPAPTVRRRLERDGELRLDHSGQIGTHFCRACQAENPLGAKQCFNCGGVIGGVDQARHDAQMRARREAARVEPVPLTPLPAADPEPAVDEREAPAPADNERVAVAIEQILEQAGSKEPGVRLARRVRGWLATGVIGSGIFGVVASTLHLLAAGLTGNRPAGVLVLEVIVTIAVTVGLYKMLADWIAEL